MKIPIELGFAALTVELLLMLVGPGMKDARRGKPAGDQLRHPVPREAVLLTAPPKRATPEVSYVMPER